jgi:hypothetical protein
VHVHILVEAEGEAFWAKNTVIDLSATRPFCSLFDRRSKIHARCRPKQATALIALLRCQVHFLLAFAVPARPQLSHAIMLMSCHLLNAGKKTQTPAAEQSHSKHAGGEAKIEAAAGAGAATDVAQLSAALVRRSETFCVPATSAHRQHSHLFRLSRLRPSPSRLCPRALPKCAATISTRASITTSSSKVRQRTRQDLAFALR